MQSPTVRLFNTLLVTFAAVFLGYGCVRFGFVNPSGGEMKGFGFFIGQIVFPLLVFKTVATAELGKTNMGVLLACNVGKWLCSSAMFAGGYFSTGGSTGEKILTGTVFAAFVISSNDFGIGFPIVQALYGHKEDMGIYIAGNALVGSLISVPGLMVLFSIGQALQKKTPLNGADRELQPNQDDDSSDSSADDSSAGAGESEGSTKQCVVILKDVILNPVIAMTIAGLVYRAVFGGTFVKDGSGLNFPHPVSDFIWLVTSPFGMSALFLTGTSMKEPSVSVTSVILVAMKVVVCAFVTYAICGTLVQEAPLLNFSFLYGMIPTSTAPLIFAIQFAPHHAEAVAAAILWSMIAGGPMMYVAALFLEAAHVDMAAVVSDVQLATSTVALSCGVASFPLMVLAMVCGVRKGAYPQELLLVGLAAALFAEEVVMVYLNPHLGDSHCAAYNAEQGRSTMGRSVCWLQRTSHLILLSMQVLMSIGGSASTMRGVIILVACCAMAVAPSMLMVPNTVGEICSLVAPPLGNVSLIPNAIWNFLLLGATVAIPLYSRSRRRKPAEPTSGEMCKVVVDGLVAFAVLRYFMQFVNTIQVILGESVMGAFAQMLALENLFEHGQLLVLFLLASMSTSFTATIASVMKSCPKASTSFLKPLGTF